MSGLGTLVQVGGALLVVVVLALLAARVARRAGVAGGGLGLQVVDRAGLSRDAAVAVVEVAGRALVVGVTAQGVSVLTELTGDELAAARAAGEPDARPSRLRAPRLVPRQGSRSGAERPAAVTGTGDDTRLPHASAGVRVTRVDASGGAPVVVTERGGTGSVLDPRTWAQAMDALREATVRKK